MNTTEILQHTIENLGKHHSPKHLLIGFDGFVDEIIHVVDQRENPQEYKRLKTITALSDRIASVAGLSANIELVPLQQKLGGNGPIMANALLAQGHEVTYIGALGKHQIDPVFHDMAERCRKVFSLADPGHTDALEFHDGKLMLGKMDSLVNVSLKSLLSELPEDALRSLLSETDLVGFTNWTMLSNLNEIISAFGRITETLKNKPRVFIDLADPQKRTEKAIQEVLDILSSLPSETVLSMNENESSIISKVLGIKEEQLMPRAQKIREQMDIFGIVIHPLKGAAMATEAGSVWTDGPYTEEPKLTTGAGDNFNAGFCNAWLAGLDPVQCLMTGVCTSGYYVRHEGSPSWDELLQFMKKWRSLNCGDV
ncbi:MAG: carbohydrate kinase family protein [Bacteroidales bacterium]